VIHTISTLFWNSITFIPNMIKWNKLIFKRGLLIEWPRLPQVVCGPTCQEGPYSVPHVLLVWSHLHPLLFLFTPKSSSPLHRFLLSPPLSCRGWRDSPKRRRRQQVVRLWRMKIDTQSLNLKYPTRMARIQKKTSTFPDYSYGDLKQFRFRVVEPENPRLPQICMKAHSKVTYFRLGLGQ
jgi:hypothetical protein